MTNFKQGTLDKCKSVAGRGLCAADQELGDIFYFFLFLAGWCAFLPHSLLFAHPADASGILACGNKANVNPDESS